MRAPDLRIAQPAPRQPGWGSVFRALPTSFSGAAHPRALWREASLLAVDQAVSLVGHRLVDAATAVDPLANTVPGEHQVAARPGGKAVLAQAESLRMTVLGEGVVSRPADIAVIASAAHQVVGPTSAA
jgi:hypothetical protein